MSEGTNPTILENKDEAGGIQPPRSVPISRRPQLPLSKDQMEGIKDLQNNRERMRRETVARSRAVKITPLFWHPEIKVPEINISMSPVELESKVCDFVWNVIEVERQQRYGKVERDLVMNTILQAWDLRGRAWRIKGLDQKTVNIFDEAIGHIAEIAKKYGFSKIWKAAWRDTMIQRLETVVANQTDEVKIYHCGRCGRMIWVPESVARGLGPVCAHKVGR